MVASKILMREKYGWKKIHSNGVIIWFKGYILSDNLDKIKEKILDYAVSEVQHSEMSLWVKTIRGHFALVIESENWVFAAVDRVGSIPIFYTENNSQNIVGNYAQQLKEYSLSICAEINKSATLEIAMSGYTIGRKTIYKELYQLTAGECLFLQGDKIERSFYYTYSPWNVRERSEESLCKEFSEVTLGTLKQMVESVDGEQIVIPLSAGNDSRLIASGLRHLGVKNVICFSYGKAGNYEEETSKQVAKKLNYPWFSVPVTIKSQRDFFTSEHYNDYVAQFDTLSSVPAVQDIAEVIQLRNISSISKYAVIVNGNSGDFITGGHIPSLARTPSEDNTKSEKDILINTHIDKHYSLWGCLKSDEATRKIKSEIDILIANREIPDSFSFDGIHGLIEVAEYLGRQSKYVVNQQNSYDYAGFEWRLPLWDGMFMDFWESVPVQYKINQNLYKKSLKANDWGGVWTNLPVNHNKISPLYLKLLRNLTKVFFIPLGKGHWHRVEKNLFNYWLDVSCNSAIVPYSDVLLDLRGQRNYVSWLADKYLISHKQEKIKKGYPG